MNSIPIILFPLRGKEQHQSFGEKLLLMFFPLFFKLYCFRDEAAQLQPEFISPEGANLNNFWVIGEQYSYHIIPSGGQEQHQSFGKKLLFMFLLYCFRNEAAQLQPESFHQEEQKIFFSRRRISFRDKHQSWSLKVKLANLKVDESKLMF